MGKYMRKGNITIVEIPNKYSSVGVCTRSRTLALQPISDLCFLQLRSRRLEKPLFQPSSPPAISTNASNEASFGENNLELDSKESPRDSLTRDAEVIGTPSSTTRPTCSFAVNRGDRTMQSAIPTTLEMEEFFAAFELHQQELFLQRYNYDIVNDMPQPGRYEWVRVDN